MRLIPSANLVDRTIAIETAYTLARLKVLERLPGNPIGIAYRHLDDGLVATMARHLPSPSFNCVRGLRPGHEHHVAPLVAWYRDNGVTARFAIVPGQLDPGLARELANSGCHQSEFHVAVVGEPDHQPPAPNGIDVQAVTDAARMETFLDAYVAGWGVPDKDHARFKANVRPWREQPGWYLFVAQVDGHPAGAATLFLHDGAAYLADATTDPRFRGRGIQAALLRQRIYTASQAGAEFICSGAAFLSTSHRNMERIGMRVLFVRAIWTQL
jgi:GNAT superfamily N-acetyltransferase